VGKSLAAPEAPVMLFCGNFSNAKRILQAMLFALNFTGESAMVQRAIPRKTRNKNAKKYRIMFAKSTNGLTRFASANWKGKLKKV
jgi:hypothetical protein